MGPCVEYKAFLKFLVGTSHLVTYCNVRQSLVKLCSRLILTIVNCHALYYLHATYVNVVQMAQL